jgi:ATPase subunit of ABC transporter with duplicated ATPase domains
MIQLQGLSFERAGRLLLEDLTITFEGHRHGLVGANGVGKSTLARLIAGEESATAGAILRAVAVTYLPQWIPRPAGTVDERLAEIWSSPVACPGRIQQWVGTLDPTCPLEALSGGEWMKLRLAEAFCRPGAFLILDEPTNDLDREGRGVLRGLLRDFAGGLLLISHDRELLREVDEVLELTPTGLHRYRGSFDAFWEHREHQRAVQREHLREAEKVRKRIERESREVLLKQEKRMRSGARRGASGGEPKVLLGAKKRRAEGTLGRLARRGSQAVEAAHGEVGAARDALESDPFLRLDFAAATPPGGAVLYEVRELNFRYPGAPCRLWRAGLQACLRGRDRWHLRGGNGSGKSTVLKLLLGAVEGETTGEVRRSPRPAVYLDQHQGLLEGACSILENCARDSRFDGPGLRNELAFYGFTGEKVFQIVDTLSGGERLRAALARIFLGPALPEAVFLDEPTNNLDFQSLELLERALSHFRGLLVVVSHDEEFVSHLGITHTLDLEP